MKKILYLLIGLSLIATPVSAQQLWEYASFNERADIATSLGLIDVPQEYIGDYETNLALLGYFGGVDEQFGASGGLPVTDYQTTLTVPLTSSATTINVASVTTIDDHPLTSSDIAPAVYLVLEPDSSNKKEIIKCTGISNLTFTGCTRGLAFYGTSEAAVTANQKSHSAGTTVILSNVHFYYVSPSQEQTWTANQTIASSTTSLTQDFILGTSTPSFFRNAAGVLQYCNNGASCAAIGAGANTYNFVLPIIESGIDVKIATTTANLDFGLDANNKFVINTSTGSVIDSFWDDQWNATTTKNLDFAFSDNLTIGGNATTTGKFEVQGRLYNKYVPYYGDGRDGALNVISATTFNTASSTIDATSVSGASTVYVADTTQFTTSTKVFLHQTQGTGAGLWEMITVADVDGTLGTITSSEVLKNSYQSTGAQAILVNQYTTVAFKTSGALNSANQYASTTDADPQSGGIIVMYASEGIIIEDDVTITMDGFGFTGGINTLSGTGEQGEGSAGPSGTVSQSANGNGGGGGTISGGGTGGEGIIDSVSSYFSLGLSMQLGGGGGAGYAANGSGTSRGGEGGGIIIFITPSFINLGTITNDGLIGAAGNSGNGSGHGGGGGGTIAIFSEQIYNRVTPTITGGTAGANDGAAAGDLGGGGGEALPGNNAGVGGVGLIISGYPFGALPRI